MPGKDGYQTSQDIRKQEREEGSQEHQLIIAMTANALLGDREECLKAGMDEYISKPLNPQKLYRMLEHWFILDDKSESAPISTKLDHVTPPVDITQLDSFTGGDREEEMELVEFFLEQANESLEALLHALSDAEKEVWRSNAHRLKGSTGNVGATHMHQLCAKAEISFEDDESSKQLMLDDIMAEYEKVKDYFKQRAS